MRSPRSLFLLALGLIAGAALASGCDKRCTTDLDCGPSGRCTAGACSTPLMQPPPAREDHDGWDDPPGSGRMFIIESFEIAPAGQGFNLDGKCNGPGDCIDNAMAPVGVLVNDQIRQGLLGGESLLLIEIAGDDELGIGEAVTLKVYPARDADDPFFPANNFQIPAGDTTCCTFKIEQSGLTDGPNPQSMARFRAWLEDRRLTQVELGAAMLRVPVSQPLRPLVSVVAVAFDLRVETQPAKLEGSLGAALPIHSLSAVRNPYCKTVSDPLCPALIPESSFLDLMIALFEPDLDLDGDGLEKLHRDVVNRGRVESCADGDGSMVPPEVSDEHWTCADSPRMADGFSVTFDFKAVGAHSAGLAP